jgi:hypothetical protein
MHLEKTFRQIEDILRNAKWRVSYRVNKKSRTYMETHFFASITEFEKLGIKPKGRSMPFEWFPSSADPEGEVAHARALYTEKQTLKRLQHVKLRISERKHLVQAIGYIEWEVPEDPQTEALVLYYINYKNLILKGVKLVLNDKTRKVEARGTSDAKDFGPSEALFYAAYFPTGNILLKTGDEILYIIQNATSLTKKHIFNIVNK